MSYNGFLKISGFKGGSQATGHKDEMEIKKWKQRFTYGKQDLRTQIENYDLSMIHKHDFKYHPIKELRERMPDMLKMRQYLIDDELRQQRQGEKFQKMVKAFEDWRYEYERELSRLKDELRNSNEELDDAFNNFKDLIDKFNDRLKDSKHEAMEFDKYVDTASAKLLEVCCSGAKIPSCTFSLYRSIHSAAASTVDLGKPNEMDFVEVTLTNVYVIEYEISYDGEDLPLETLRFNYDKAQFKFIEGDPSTGKRGANKIISWDWTDGEAKAS